MDAGAREDMMDNGMVRPAACQFRAVGTSVGGMVCGRVLVRRYLHLPGGCEIFQTLYALLLDQAMISSKLIKILLARIAREFPRNCLKICKCSVRFFGEFAGKSPARSLAQPPACS